jgi:hypothetical protein
VVEAVLPDQTLADQRAPVRTLAWNEDFEWLLAESQENEQIRRTRGVDFLNA